VEGFSGEAGDFSVTVRRRARYVDENKCTGCGSCAEKCPTPVSDDFNLGLDKRKAIYKYFAQGIPSVFTIDTRFCRQFQGKKCGICQKTCQAGAVDFEQQDRIETFNVGAVIVAVGYELFDASRITEYGYGRLPNVISALEFERLLSASGPTHGHVERPSDLAAKARLGEVDKELKRALKSLESYEKKGGLASAEFYQQFQAGAVSGNGDEKAWADKYRSWLDLRAENETLAKKVAGFDVATRLAFIQCVGSRDFRYHPYCSSYCCMHTIKEAIIAKEHAPRTESTVFAMDLRTVGKGFEEYKVRGAENSGIRYIRGRVAEITQDGDCHPVIWYEDTKKREVLSQTFDLVILANACSPIPGAAVLAGTLGTRLDDNQFFATDSLNPLSTSIPGIFTCGCAQGPMDIPESVAQASSAAAKAAEVVLKVGN
jgi:heterodisulfide reductase subunit A-like polyferredoxin